VELVIATARNLNIDPMIILEWPINIFCATCYGLETLAEIEREELDKVRNK